MDYKLVHCSIFVSDRVSHYLLLFAGISVTSRSQEDGFSENKEFVSCKINGTTQHTIEQANTV